MKFDLMDGDPAREAEDYSEKRKKHKIIVVPRSIAQELRSLSEKQRIDATECLREGRVRLIRRMLIRAGKATGFSVPHASFLLSVTERTVRNWIAEAELGPMFSGKRRIMRMEYRGVVIDLDEQVATIHTPWCDSYGSALKRARYLAHSYSILHRRFEVETRDTLD